MALHEAEWRCSTCSWDNSGRDLICSNCHASRPGVINETPQAAESRPASSDATNDSTNATYEVPHLPSIPIPHKSDQEKDAKHAPVARNEFSQGKIKPPGRKLQRTLKVLCLIACLLIAASVPAEEQPIWLLASLIIVVVLLGTAFIKRKAWAFTGIVSFRQHGPPYPGVGWSGGGPSSMPLLQLDDRRTAVGFRLSLVDENGNSTGEISVRCGIENVDYYVQEGDLVTVIGDRSDDLINPLLINHTSQTLTEPYTAAREPIYKAEEEWRIFFNKYRFPWAIGLGILLPCSVFFYAADRNPAQPRQTVVVLLLLALAGALILALTSRGKLRSRVLYRYAKVFVKDWKTLKVKNPLGVIEGASTFQRHEFNPFSRQQSSRTWAIFRTAVYSDAGDLLFRLVGVSRESDMSSQLRVGDWVKWHGEYKTTEIHRYAIVETSPTLE